MAANWGSEVDLHGTDDVSHAAISNLFRWADGRYAAHT
jgi:hypothetical protein